jgi:hypothetical protein
MTSNLVIAAIVVIILLVVGYAIMRRREKFVPTYPMPCRSCPWPLPAGVNQGQISPALYDELEYQQYANWTDLRGASGTRVYDPFSDQSRVSLTGGGEAPSLRPRYQPANPVSGIGMTSRQRLWDASDPAARALHHNYSPSNPCCGATGGDDACPSCRTIFEVPFSMMRVKPDSLTWKQNNEIPETSCIRCGKSLSGVGTRSGTYVAGDNSCTCASNTGSLNGLIHKLNTGLGPPAGRYDKTFYRKMGIPWSSYDLTPTYPNINLPPSFPSSDIAR